MPTARTRNERGYRSVGGMMLAVALAAMIGGLSATPASADDHGRNDQRHDQRRPVRVIHRDAPQYVYAPPPVYYAPPERRPVIDLVFPFEFR
jgi:hypothetical protein